MKILVRNTNNTESCEGCYFDVVVEFSDGTKHKGCQRPTDLEPEYEDSCDFLGSWVIKKEMKNGNN